MMSAPRIAVIGFGNLFRGDDAIGLEVVRRLRRGTFPQIRATEVVSDATNLAAAWEGCETAVVIDAMVSGRRPGTIRRLSLEEVMGSAAQHFRSTHGLGLPEGLRFAKALECLPERLVVFGVEGREFGVGEPMSSEVAAAVDSVIKQVLEEVHSVGLQVPISHRAADRVGAGKERRDA